MKFDYQGHVPLFQQVAEQIELAIYDGSFPEGEQVPSTTEVANSYQINPATVLKGMNLLVDKGLLEKRRGLGMFVCPGARQLLTEDKRRTFITQDIPEFIRKAKKLHITKADLLSFIEKEDLV